MASQMWSVAEVELLYLWGKPQVSYLAHAMLPGVELGFFELCSYAVMRCGLGF